MGYTHYWKKADPILTKDWVAFTLRVNDILKTAIKDGYRVQLDFYDDKPPLVGRFTVRFNGVGADGHETFMLNRHKEDFAFCKTARNPYDAVVVAILMVAEALLPGFEWSSDGDDEDDAFNAGKELAMRAYVEYAEDPTA